MLNIKFIFEPKRKKATNTNLTFFGALLLAVNGEKKIPNQLVKAIIYNGNVVKILVLMKELNYFVERNPLAYFLLRMHLLSY